jgi:hypothetical protein
MPKCRPVGPDFGGGYLVVRRLDGEMVICVLYNIVVKGV